jgi:hypothetical protein
MKIKIFIIGLFWGLQLTAKDSLCVVVDSVQLQLHTTDTITSNNDTTVKNYHFVYTNPLQDSSRLPLQKISIFADAPTFNKNRFIAVGSSTLVALVGSYYYLNNAWWSGQKTKFKFDGGYKVLDMFSLGKDALYAMNLDKFGHFYGGHLVGEWFYDMVKWSGKTREQSLKWAGIFGSSVALFIEIKDGFSPTWGFSLHDFAAGSLGSFYPYLQSKSRFLNALDYKWSYYRRNNYYFKCIDYEGEFQDDYSNHTFWFTFNPKRYSPKAKWPKWLGVSVGIGIDDTWNNYHLGKANVVQGAGAYEFYLAPDIDFRALLPQKPGWQRVAKVLNFIKFPTPALRFGKTTQFLPIHF